MTKQVPAKKRTGVTISVQAEERAILKELCEAEERSMREQVMFMARRRLIELRKKGVVK